MDKTLGGWINGFIGMLIFSGSLPATRAAVSGFDPLFVTAARGGIAGGLGLLLLLLFRQKRPVGRDLAALGIVAVGVVAGFPLLTGLALKHITSAHSLVFIGLLPLSTATFAVLRGGERPRPMFWLFSGMGAMLVAGYSLKRADGVSLEGDGLMLAAIVLCGLGYAEGGRLSRILGGWQVICWALLLALPLNAVLIRATLPLSWTDIAAPAWIGLGYVSVFSMLVGFVFWYRGLALGGIAVVGQLQLLQPFFGLMLAASLLHEPVGWPIVAVSTAVAACVAGARRFA